MKHSVIQGETCTICRRVLSKEEVVLIEKEIVPSEVPVVVKDEVVVCMKRYLLRIRYFM